MAKSAEGKIGPKLEKADDFARHFLADVLGGASGQVWRGAGAQTVRAVGYHAPMSVLVRTDIYGAWIAHSASRSHAHECYRIAYSYPIVD